MNLLQCELGGGLEIMRVHDRAMLGWIMHLDPEYGVSAVDGRGQCHEQAALGQRCKELQASSWSNWIGGTILWHDTPSI